MTLLDMWYFGARGLGHVRWVYGRGEEGGWGMDLAFEHPGAGVLMRIVSLVESKNAVENRDGVIVKKPCRGCSMSRLVDRDILSPLGIVFNVVCSSPSPVHAPGDMACRRLRP